MSRFSIRGKIFYNYAAIIALAIIIIFIGVFEFNVTREYTDHIVLLNTQNVNLVKLKGYLETLEHNLDVYFVIGGELYKEKINNGFDNISALMDTLMENKFSYNLISSLNDLCLKLNTHTVFLLAQDFKRLSTREQNQLIIDIYSELKEINRLHSSCSDANIKQLNYYIDAQYNSIRFVIVVFFIIGFIILILYIILGINLSNKISEPPICRDFRTAG